MKLCLRTTVNLLIVAAAMATSLHAQQPAANAKAATQATTVPLLSHLDSQLPSWLKFSGEYRMRGEGFDGGGFNVDTRDAYFLSRLRLNMRVTPARWMRFQFQVQDAQAAWKNAKPDGPPFEDSMDLRAAYVEFGQAEASPVTLRVGRQELVFGEQRLIGHLNWTNTARSFDAARLTLQHGVVKVDVFASSVVNLREGVVNKSSGGNNLHGVYGSIARIIPNATVEPFVLWRLSRGTRTEAGVPGLQDRKIVGVRWVGKLPKNFDYGVDVVGQGGTVGTDDIDAIASHWVVGYTMPRVKMKPRIVVEYNHASGDETPGDGKQGTFDQLYPTGHDKYGLADQVGWKNIQDIRAGVEFKPTAKISMNAFYHSWWLATPRDGLYNAAGAQIVRVPAGTAGRHVGQEADVQMVYSFNSQTSIGAGYANVFPGTFLKNATPGKQYRIPYVMLTYSF